ncbi:iron-siderophore ABC transporter substrate-binding protein [Hoyosella rhizosphaerae]|nr:iron-siderophore ABC transporter substrate-binding protein [Hoyosella rhizosphaerae]
MAFISVLLGTLMLSTACGTNGGTGDEQAASASGDFPRTIEHAFGETVIPTDPTRVVAWGWGSADAAIALGVTPVAMAHQSYGGDDEGVLPWVREALADSGEATPAILPAGTDVPFEAIAAAEPDLILAVYSGITESEYELLSEIAPTIAYPDAPWSTPWRDTIRIVGDALGRVPEATQLLADIDAEVAEKAEAHPELAGKSVALVWDTADALYVYKPADSRVAFTLDLGLVNPDSVDELSNGDSTFYFTLSRENLGELTSDILVTYADSEQQSTEFLESPAAQLMDQVRRGTVAEVIGTEFIAAVSPPTALSLTWGLDDYVALLSDAAEKVDG